MNNIKKNLRETIVKEKVVAKPAKLHNVDFFISTEGGMTMAVARKLLSRREVRSASRSIGQHDIDLRVAATLKDSEELLRLLETINGMEGVRDAMWNEVVQVVEIKK